jgi:transcriptional regulator with XRE-family HTH domain
MDAKWTRLGAAFAEGRSSQNLTQDDVVARSGIGLSTIQAIERGGPFKGVTASMRLYAVLLGWAPGSIEAVLDGGDPTELPPAAGQSNLKGLPYRIAQALNEGTTIEARLRAIGPGGEIVLVVKGREGATDAEKRAILREWERQEGWLDRLGEVADDPSDNG